MMLLTLEAEGMGMGDDATKDDPERYALFIRLAYKALKEANPSAKLAAAGSAGNPCTYDEALESCGSSFPPELLNANYFKKVFQEINCLVIDRKLDSCCHCPEGLRDFSAKQSPSQAQREIASAKNASQ